MKCSDVQRLLPDLSLGDLDREPAREIEAHLSGCAECRASKGSLERTVGALHSAPPVAPSTERRVAVAAAMAKAQAEEAERLLVRPRRLGVPWAAAAGLLILAGSGLALLWRPAAAPAFRVTSISGHACFLHAGTWRALAPGQALAAGDRLVTEEAAVARVEFGGGSVTVDQDASLEVLSARRLTLDRGRLYVDVREPLSEPFMVADTRNHFVALRQGALEVGFHAAEAVVLGHPGNPDPRRERARRLVARVAAGEADLGGSHEQRLRVAAGQEGRFNFAGQPSAGTPAPGEVAPWRKTGYYEKR